MEILDLRLCSSDELEAYITYLASAQKPQPVLEHQLAQFLRNGDAHLYVGRLPSLYALGALVSFWGELGDVGRSELAELTVGRKWFLVREAMAVFQRVDPPGHPDLESIAYHSHCDEAAQQCRILLYADPNQPYLIDGNHAAVAVYERRSALDDWTFKPELHVLITPGWHLGVLSHRT